MALAETARLVVDLSLKGNFARDLRKTSGALGQFEARMDRTESRAFRAGQQIGTGIKRGAALAAVGIGVLTTQVIAGLDQLVELEKQTAQTNAVIKSTGGIAGITAGEVRAMAEEFESLNATIDDKVIQDAENLLLTFTNVTDKAFKPAIQAALDMNTALGGGEAGLQQTIIQLGKALNDPERGLTALRKVGVAFTKDQLKQIKALAKSGKIYEAQRLILAELNKEFGGSFPAEGATTAGKVAKFRDAIEDLQKTLASGLLPVVGNVADALSELFLDPAIQKGVADFGQDLAKVLSAQNIKSFISDIREFAGIVAPGIRAAAGAVGTTGQCVRQAAARLAQPAHRRDRGQQADRRAGHQHRGRVGQCHRWCPQDHRCGQRHRHRQERDRGRRAARWRTKGRAARYTSGGSWRGWIGWSPHHRGHRPDRSITTSHRAGWWTRGRPAQRRGGSCVDGRRTWPRCRRHPSGDCSTAWLAW